MTMKLVWMVLALSCGLVWAGTGCSQATVERKMQGLTGVVFNYSDEAIAEVRVDGELAGTGYEGVPPGGVTGGGSSCCMAMDPTKDTVRVTIVPALDEAYEVQAQVEQPWPQGASTAIVHLLPGRKVVIETTLGYGISARQDLMQDQLKALGIPMEVDHTFGMLPGRNEYTEYMESGQ